MIRFWCACGRRVQARRADAGRAAVCPLCGRSTTVPDADQPGDSPVSGAGDLLDRLAEEFMENNPPEAPLPGSPLAPDGQPRC